MRFHFVYFNKIVEKIIKKKNYSESDFELKIVKSILLKAIKNIFYLRVNILKLIRFTKCELSIEVN